MNCGKVTNNIIKLKEIRHLIRINDEIGLNNL